MRFFGFVAVALVLLSTSAARAGLKLTYERKKAGEDAKVTTSIITVEGGRIRMEGMAGGGRHEAAGAMVIDEPGKKMLMIDAQRKTYREITETDAKQVRERMVSQRAKTLEHFKEMPPAERKLAEERMGTGPGEGPPAVKYKALGTKKKVAGFACEMYRVTVAGQNRETCFAPWASKIASKSESANFKKAMIEMEKSFDFNPGVRMTDWVHAPGIPVEESLIGTDGKPQWTQTLKSVSQGPIPASEFQPPAGFTKQAPPMGGPAAMSPAGAPDAGKPAPRPSP
jgi:hypothetical protein